MEIETPKEIDTDLRIRQVDDQLGSYHSGFIRKVFALIATQVLLTVSVIVYVKSSEQTMELMKENLWLLVPVVVVFLVTAVVPLCCGSLGRKVPINYAILYTFTLCAAVLVAYVALDADDGVLIAAGVLTIVVTAALIASAVLCATSSLVSGSLISIFFMTSAAWLVLLVLLPDTPWMTVSGCSLGALCFGAYIILDMTLILDGNSYGITSDDYVFCAMLIYLDMVNLFLKLLRLLQALKDG